MTEQVLHNLANFIDSDMAYPAQIVINSGTATTSDTANASYSTPLSAAATATNQIVRTVAAAPSTTATTLATDVTAGSSLGVTGTNARTQNWSYAPVTNAFEAARLMALYRFAVDNYEPGLRDNYPKIFKSVSHLTNRCLTDSLGNRIFGTYTPEQTSKSTTGLYIRTAYTRCLTTQTQTMGSQFTFTEGSDTSSIMTPDPYYLQGPTCVLCIPPKSFHLRGLVINPRLKGHWLHWRALARTSGARPDTYQPGDVRLGQFGNYELFVDKAQQSKLPEFVVFVLAASTQTDTSSTGAGGIGGGNGIAQAKQALQGGNCVIDGANVITCP